MHKPNTKFIPAWLALALALSAPAGAQQPDAGASTEEEPVYDENTVECVPLRSIRRTEVLDDRNVLFYMRGTTVYHNILSRACGGLAREDRFSYETSMGRLCRMDYISVLYNDGFGVRAGNRCSLGAFHKIDREDAEALREGLEGRPAANPLPLPTPQEVGEDEDAEEEEPR